MTVNEAFREFSQSEKYKQLCKGIDSSAAKYRVYLGRFKKGKLKIGAMVEMLIANGYEVKANKVTKRHKNPTSA